MSLRNWRRTSQDPEHWRTVLEDAKGLFCEEDEEKKKKKKNNEEANFASSPCVWPV